MLLQIGSVLFRGNSGPSLEGLSRRTEASLAAKNLMSGLPGREWTGWDGSATVSGTVLPFHLGGLSDVEALHGWCADGTAVPLIRGDGAFLGWFAIQSVDERHESMARNGVGYEVSWTVSLVRVARPSGSSIEALISGAAALAEKLLGAAGSVLATLFG